MATAYQPLSRRLQSFLRCSICLKLGETKVLPCKHWLCQGCIFKICSKKDENGQSACPFCDSCLDRKPDQYLVCRVIQYFQKHQGEIEGLLEKVIAEGCNAKQCINAITKICRECTTMCCSETNHHNECSVADDGAHDLEDIIGYCQEIRASFDQWVAKKQALIQDYKSQRDVTILEIKQKGQELVDASSEDIQQLTATTATALSHLEAELSRMNESILEEKTTLRFVQGVTGGILDVELVVIYSHLVVYDQKQEIKLGHYESLMKEFDGCDIAWSPAGHLLIAKDGGIDVVEITTIGTATVITTLLEGEDIFSIDVFKENILVAVSLGEPYGPTEVVTISKEYKEVGRWAVSLSAIDFAVMDNQVIFSVRELPSLKVYSMSGKAQPDILCENPASGIFGVFDGLVLTDETNNKVYRKKSFESKCTWIAEVITPFTVCVDSNELVWIRSNKYDCITILSRHGKKLQVIENEEFTALTNWGGIMVHGGYLYVAHEGGAGRFKIFHVDV